MRFYIKSADGLNFGGDYYVADFLPGHWGVKNEGTTYITASDAQDVIDEFIVQKEFWYKSNREKEDRMHMRDHAHIHIDEIYRVYKLSNQRVKNAV